MPPLPERGPFEYVPDAGIFDRYGWSLPGDAPAGANMQARSEQELKRKRLQRQAEQLIRDTAKPYNDNPDVAALAPAVMRALYEGGKPEEIAVAIKRRIGADKADEARVKSIQSDFQPGGPNAAKAPAKPGTTQPIGTGDQFDPVKQLEVAARAYAGAMPKPEDYPHPAEYRLELEDWSTSFGEIQKTLTGFREAAAGLTRMQDGTIVSQADFDRLDPMAQAQVRQHLDANTRALEESYNKTMNDIGLSEYTIARTGKLDANAVAQARFTNDASVQASKIAYDQTNVNRAAQDISRAVSGRADSRDRARLVTDTLRQAAGWATGGKQEFTGNDFGGLLAGLITQAGRNPADVAMRFPTQVNLDPAGLLAGYDAANGVEGPLPRLPSLISSPSDVPRAPVLNDVTVAAPTFLRPRAPGGGTGLLTAPTTTPTAASPRPYVYGDPGLVP